MRPNGRQRRAGDGPLSPPGAPDGFPGNGNQAQADPSRSAGGDSEGSAWDWEAAWIDLGGEG
jgi:hypothetical protein